MGNVYSVSLFEYLSSSSGISACPKLNWSPSVAKNFQLLPHIIYIYHHCEHLNPIYYFCCQTSTITNNLPIGFLKSILGPLLVILNSIARNSVFKTKGKKKKKRTWTKGNGQIDLALLSNKMISDKRKMSRVFIKMQNTCKVDKIQ